MHPVVKHAVNSRRSLRILSTRTYYNKLMKMIWLFYLSLVKDNLFHLIKLEILKSTSLNFRWSIKKFSLVHFAQPRTRF